MEEIIMKTLSIIKKAVLAGFFGLCLVSTGSAEKYVKFTVKEDCRSTRIIGLNGAGVVAFEGKGSKENGDTVDLFLCIPCLRGQIFSLKKKEFDEKDINELSKNSEVQLVENIKEVVGLVYGDKK
jgi:hypothetical protein